MTTVRGITSRVDIVWRRNGMIVYNKEGVIANFTTEDTLVYTDLCTITQLNTSDDSAIYQCDVIINIHPKVIASRLVTLDITGMCITSSQCSGNCMLTLHVLDHTHIHTHTHTE